jgi:hypothetical protein
MSLTTRDEQAPPDPDIPPAVPAVGGPAGVPAGGAAAGVTALDAAGGVPAVGVAAGVPAAAGGESPVSPIPAVPGLVVLAADDAPMCSDGVCL